MRACVCVIENRPEIPETVNASAAVNATLDDEDVAFFQSFEPSFENSAPESCKSWSGWHSSGKCISVLECRRFNFSDVLCVLCRILKRNRLVSCQPLTERLDKTAAGYG